MAWVLGSYPPAASAHRDDYIDETLVYLTLDRGEFETEYWFDRGRESGQGMFTRHNAAVEWGVTDHWMVDGRVTAIVRDGSNFDSARVESRYRFSEEGALPVDTAVSLELNTERESDGSKTTGLEPRVILSKDFGARVNVTANLSEEIPLDSGTPSFLAAFGGRWNMTDTVRIGSELQYNFHDHRGAAIPQLWFAVSRELTVKLGYSHGIDREPKDFARLALEAEF